MKTKISVIIPVFDTEKYLAGCIDSLLVQTLTDFEILLIIDGSPDHCSEICDEYITRDSRITILHKKNGGVSSARNIGLDHAQGEYICFVDSDDTVGNHYLQNLMPLKGEDFIQGGVTILEDDYLKQYMTHEEIFKDYNQFWLRSRQQWPTKCCLSKAIIDKWNIRYNPSLKMGEDGLFNHIFLNKVSLIRRTQADEYYYNHDNDLSSSHKYYSDRLDQQIQLIRELERYFSDGAIYRVRWDYWKEVLNHYCVKGLRNADPIIRDQAKQAIKRTFKTKEFLKCLPFMRSYGSLDERLETYFMGYYRHCLYLPTLRMVQMIYRIKNVLFRRR